MLEDIDVQPMLAVSDLEQAKKFYRDTLGLELLSEEPGTAITFRSGRGALSVYASQYAGTNQATAALWEVEDVDDVVQALRDKGVRFEHYDLPGLRRDGDVHRSGTFAVAWFKDPGGNILSVQTSRAASERRQAPAEREARP